MTAKYLFQSERLGFRNWARQDLKPMTAINADPEVMEFFPRVQTSEDTANFIDRMQTQFTEKDFCYFAVDRLDNDEFIGFIGLSAQTYEADFTPCIDIGWRLSKSAWGNGYATEGAKASLKYGFEALSLKKIYSIASAINTPSINIMEKIGMQKVKTFEHSLLLEDKRLKSCVLYSAER